jgi:hypothetical protein
MSNDLAINKLGQWIVPLIQGFIVHKTVTVVNQSVSILVIARRNWHRAGRRYTTRGIDNDGYASNFVETEQIIYLNNNNGGGNGGSVQVASHVQTRGIAQQISLKTLLMEVCFQLVALN